MDDADWLDRTARKISRRLGVEFDDARQTLALYRAKGEVHWFAFLHAYRELKKTNEIRTWSLNGREDLLTGRHQQEDVRLVDLWPKADERMRELTSAHLLFLNQEEIGELLNCSSRQVRRIKTELIKRIADTN